MPFPKMYIVEKLRRDGESYAKRQFYRSLLCGKAACRKVIPPWEYPARYRIIKLVEEGKKKG